jgi:hypothetical protein
LEMDARICTQLLDVMQRDALTHLGYLLSVCTSRDALRRHYGLSYLIRESCPADVLSAQMSARTVRGDALTAPLAYMLLK